MSSIKLVRVQKIEDDTLYWGSTGKMDYQKVQLSEECGWWINKLEIRLYPRDEFYGCLQIGDKLRLTGRPIPWKKFEWEVEEIKKEDFDECPTCFAYKQSSDHICPPSDSIRIDGEGKIIKAKKNISGCRLYIKYMYDSEFPFTFSPIIEGMGIGDVKVGENFNVTGWLSKSTGDYRIILEQM